MPIDPVSVIVILISGAVALVCLFFFSGDM